MPAIEHSSDVVTVLKDLIAIESVNPQFGGSGEAEVARYIERFFAPCNPTIEHQHVFNGRENLICYFPGRNANKTLLFEAHMDTVSIPPGARSTTKPELDGNRLYGRGACDTKGSLAAMICAIRSVLESEGAPPVNLCFLATVDEEYRAGGVYEFIKHSVRADGAVIGEPTGLKIVTAHKGVYRFHLVTRGKSVQSSKPHQGINAIYYMMDFVQAVRNELQASYLGREHPLTGAPTISIGVIRGGNEVNTVPSRCMVEVDRRVIPGEQRLHVEREIEDLLRSLSRKDPLFDAVIENPFFDPPLDTDPESQFVRTMKTVCENLGGRGEVVGVPYGSDASKIATLGIPSIVFGPGDIGDAHSPHEYVGVDDLGMAMRVYRQLIQEFGR